MSRRRTTRSVRKLVNEALPLIAAAPLRFRLKAAWYILRGKPNPIKVIS